MFGQRSQLWRDVPVIDYSRLSAVVLLEFAFAEMTAGGFDTFSEMVKSGDFDRIPVRPQSEPVRVPGSKFELSRIGRIIQAVVMFAYGILKSEVDWNLSKICTILFMSACWFLIPALLFWKFGIRHYKSSGS